MGKWVKARTSRVDTGGSMPFSFFTATFISEKNACDDATSSSPVLLRTVSRARTSHHRMHPCFRPLSNIPCESNSASSCACDIDRPECGPTGVCGMAKSAYSGVRAVYVTREEDIVSAGVVEQKNKRPAMRRAAGVEIRHQRKFAPKVFDCHSAATYEVGPASAADIKLMS